MTTTFKIGDPVWAKMKSFVPWPAIIAKHKSASAAKKRPNFYWVYFFGSKNYGWIESYNVRPYKEHRDNLINASKARMFTAAITEIEEYIEERAANPEAAEREASEPEEESVVEEAESEEPKKKKKQGVKRSTSAKKSATKSKQMKPSFRFEENGVDSPSKTYENLLNRPTVMENPTTPTPDMNSISEKNRNIVPSTLKFGFLGLGLMASGMVKNLINSGHRLNLWCEDLSKCETIKSQADANSGNMSLVDVRDSPNDVVLNSDIIFCCLSGPAASMDVVQGNCGVLHEMQNKLSNKGYVELTGIDAETSKNIQELITANGGRYLEAQVQGCKAEADAGNLIILAAGDTSLFDECLSCFTAMSKTAFHLGDVGYASKMNLILQVIHGIALAGLAEGFALAERSGLTLNDVLKIFSLTNLNCTYLHDKAQKIINEEFQLCQEPLQALQQDLKLAMGLADSLQQPLLMTSTANEIFKHARRLGYAKHDSSAVFVRARH